MPINFSKFLCCPKIKSGFNFTEKLSDMCKLKGLKESEKQKKLQIRNGNYCNYSSLLMKHKTTKLDTPNRNFY